MNRRVPVSMPRMAAAWALLLPGVIAFQPTFGGLAGYVSALVGVTVGVLLAVLAIRFAWSFTWRFASVLAAYLVLGGPLVVPDTTIVGIVPTLETLQRLTLLVVQGWQDLLTVATPAGDFSGPAAVPLLAGLIVGALFGGLVQRRAVVYWPLLVPVAWLGLAIAFGVRNAPAAVWLGAVLGAGLLTWMVVHRTGQTRQANAQILLRKEQGLSRAAIKAVAAGVVLTLSAGTAVALNITTGDGVNRRVLRDDVAPPLNLHEYASPLMKYRLYVLTQKDDVLFDVRDMPVGSRLRLAVMDTYDGVVFNVSHNSAQYLRSGRVLPWGVGGDTASATVTAVGYDDVWVPAFGESGWVEFGGDRAVGQARGLYVNRETHQALTTARMAEGTSLAIEGAPMVPVLGADREKFGDAGAGNAPLATVERVPDVLVRAATDWTTEATSAYEQLALIEERLRAEGFYSDGSDGRTRSGHTHERLASMFEARQWVGDDEQYATAMALMATQLGIPARVVLGFHPLPAGEPAPAEKWEVRGTEAHVWVEAHLDGAGWVTFDPTPDRDKKPQTDAPQPPPKPKPQVDPPPNPPEKLPDEPIVADQEAVNVDEEDEEDDEGASLAWLIVGAAAAGGALLISSPLLVIAALKARRATKRRSRGAVHDQLAGAWDEILDRARDLGYQAPTSKTRREAAANLATAYPDVDIASFAHRIDASIFGAAALDERHRDAAWHEVPAVKKALLATAPWYARPAAVFSTRSLKKRQTEAARVVRRRSKGPRAAATARRPEKESS